MSDWLQGRIALVLDEANESGISITRESGALIAQTTYSAQSLGAVVRYLAMRALQEDVELTAEFVQSELKRI